MDTGQEAPHAPSTFPLHTELIGLVERSNRSTILGSRKHNVEFLHVIIDQRDVIIT